MGFSTFLIGCIPSYETIGFMAVLFSINSSFITRFSICGEYGGAATYVAICEHNRRGYWTSWIQTTATIGFLFH
jgi:hypothetical protein